eukprot:TRINITY_DN8606_c0_g1_i1.p1 TRINITY_DN8606_c0_g1~~TRINITY_DN8606_c0_g1_i1.p1  ORF type:complete len:216 (-),score=32.23 TRINITY_DN8606_c0_g1_i1:4-651(-)
MNKVLIPFFLVLVFFLSTGSAEDAEEIKTYQIEGKVRLRIMLPNGTIYGPTYSTAERKTVHSKINLYLHGNRVEYNSYVREDGNFVIHDVLPGAYMLEALSPHFKFEPIRVEVSKRNNGRVRVTKLTSNTGLAYPIVLSPYTPSVYFEAERQLNLVGFIMGNKMLWMLGFMLVMMFGMQKMASSDMMKEAMPQEDEDAFKPEKLLPSFLTNKKTK